LNNMKKITVLAAVSQEALERLGADVEDTHLDTLREAKARARYVLTDEFMRACESSQPLGYSQVRLNGEVVADYFRKEVAL
jgi:hypothetical protein